MYIALKENDVETCELLRRGSHSKNWLSNFVLQHTQKLFEKDSVLQKQGKKVIDYYERLQSDPSVEEVINNNKTMIHKKVSEKIGDPMRRREDDSKSRTYHDETGMKTHTEDNATAAQSS